MDLFSINKIDIDTLRSMEGLLSKSVGYPTSIDDEVDYFIHESPSGWLIARDQKTQKIGFIRSFEQNQEWSLGELYVEPFVPNRKELAAKLIAQFLEINSFSPGHRLRFDFSSADVELNSAIQAVPKRSKRQRFLYFELQPSNVPTVAQSTTKEKPAAVEIAEVLSHLNSVTESEAQSWLDQDSIRFETAGNCVASAAQVYFYANSAEINRIATHSEFARQGYAERLIQKICGELKEREIPKLFLKVEDVRTPAITFYQKMGFKEVIEKEQTWHSFYLD